MSQKFRQYKNYGIISIISLFCLFFLPFTGSTAGLGFTVPDTIAGWIVYIVNKLIVAAVNILILYCFYEQGKFNVRNDPRYIEANEILLHCTANPEYKPKSPKQHALDVFGKKGVTVFITSILGTISLTQAVLVFDWITMLTYLLVITSGIIFGVIQMGNEEIWWTEDYWKYAKMIQKEQLTKGDENQVDYNENTVENSLE
jgi:hypothetical protein